MSDDDFGDFFARESVKPPLSTGVAMTHSRGGKRVEEPVEVPDKDFAVELEPVEKFLHRPRNAKERYYTGFHNDLNQFLGDDCDWEFGPVVDLGGVYGTCMRPHCNHAIRYEYWVINKSDGSKWAIGSTCITQLEFVAKHLNLSESNFLRRLKRKESEFKKRYATEDNLERYADIHDYMRRILRVGYDRFALSVVRVIEKGDTLSDEKLRAIYDVMSSGHLEQLEYANAQRDERKRRVIEDKRMFAEEVQRKNVQLGDILDKLVELAPYLTSPFVEKMVRRYERLAADARIFDEFSGGQLRSIDKIVSENDVTELETRREEFSEKRDEQATRISTILEGMSENKIWKGAVESYRSDNGEEPDPNWYQSLFQSYLSRVDKRPLTEGEEAVVARCEYKYATVITEIKRRRVQEAKSRLDERSALDAVKKEAIASANNLTAEEKTKANADFLDVLDSM